MDIGHVAIIRLALLEGCSILFSFHSCCRDSGCFSFFLESPCSDLSVYTMFVSTVKSVKILSFQGVQCGPIRVWRQNTEKY